MSSKGLGLGSWAYADLIQQDLMWDFRDHADGQHSPILRAIRVEIAERDRELKELQAEATFVWYTCKKKFKRMPNDADLIKFNHWNNQ